ncbi:ABC transporter ATP-binding protein [Microbacterium sediminis]|uniref:ABC transporter n=1 Tax=Microbacterium sediminis TaxID=904291 RepID=A0A1B9N8J4_9MICO|nr:ABC transporter ATP-binding protein [Microbacterium sediminis]OCG72864.1 ABC transporter [Microbacterium sediminis]QBR73459.1 ABC transporter ATP-binding protein [Microbacterium sediminis]
MSGTVHGVGGEDRTDYTREESKAIRRRSLRLLGSLIAPLKARVAVVAIVVVAQTALRVLGPALLGLGLNEALPAVRDGGDWTLAWVVGVTYVVTAVLGAALLMWYDVLVARVTQDILLELRTRMFRHTQRLSMEFHETYTSGRIISRQTSDLETIRELLGGGLTDLINGVLYGVFTLVALTIWDWQSSVIILLAGIPLALLMRWFYKRSQEAYRFSRVASARLIVKFVETMTGIRAGKAFRAEPRNEVEFGQLASDYRDANMRSIRIFGTFEPGLMAISAFAIGTVVLWGGVRITWGEFTVGALLTVVLYTRNFFLPLQGVAMFLNSFQAAAAALEKVSGVLEVEPTVPDPTHPTPLPDARGHVVLDEVTFGYGAGRTILPEFTLDIPAGQTVALVGTTGAGKSTLAKLVSRFYDPTEGRVMLDGVDLRELDARDLRRAIVMVTQEAYLFSGTVADNIALGRPDASLDEIVAAAEAVGADGFIRSLPDGYHTDVNKRGGRVSAGQRQLISFARAFLANPAVLILDEATASLDIPSERAIQEALQTLLADRTAIIIAHRLSTVAIADRVLVMEHGRIIEDGAPETLIAGTGKFAQLHAAWRESLV